MALELEGESIEELSPGYLIDHYAGGRVPDGADMRQHSPQAVVEHVRRQGGRCVKLYYEEALWWPGAAPDFRLPSVEIVRDVVSAAHAENLPVVLHATTPNGHQFAMDAGVDVLAHGMWEWPEQEFDAPEPVSEYEQIANEVAKSGISLQPTISTIRNTASLFDDALLEDSHWADAVPPAYVEYLKTDAQDQRQDFLARFETALIESGSSDDIPSLMDAFVSRYERLIGSMAANGASLLFGTDTAVGGFGWASPPGLAAYWEMQAWTRAGVRLRTLFESLTIGNARAFGLDAEIGTIEAGKHADLLILSTNPLDDVSAYDSISRVIIGGESIERSKLSAQALDPID